MSKLFNIGGGIARVLMAGALAALIAAFSGPAAAFWREPPKPRC